MTQPRHELVPLKISDSEINELAEVNEEDIRRTQARWQRAVEPRFVNLLLAGSPAGGENEQGQV